MEDIQVSDNRVREREKELLDGNITEMRTWAGATNVLIVLDTGYTISISKTALKRILDWSQTVELKAPGQ